MREPTARPVQADAGSPARAAEHGGDLSGVEILPGDECEQLALIGTQTPERDSGEVRSWSTNAAVATSSATAAAALDKRSRLCSARRWLAKIRRAVA